MNNEIITQDGSHSIFSEQFQATYHSKYGAVQESNHVFIQYGLTPALEQKKNISILEMGFGTGLNLLLSHLKAVEENAEIQYVGLEQYPINIEQADLLNYCEVLNLESWKDTFLSYHTLDWNQNHELQNLRFTKLYETLQNWKAEQYFDLIYFDAFAPETQPELWTIEIFEKLYNCLNSNGILTTYCAKGQVKRNLKSAGFIVESLPGPPGKREMVRAVKGVLAS